MQLHNSPCDIQEGILKIFPFHILHMTIHLFIFMLGGKSLHFSFSGGKILNPLSPHPQHQGFFERPKNAMQITKQIADRIKNETSSARFLPPIALALVKYIYFFHTVALRCRLKGAETSTLKVLTSKRSPRPSTEMRDIIGKL